jgi:hypothetical protein
VEYDVRRVEGGWRIMEVGQEPPGMFVGDDWLRAAGLSAPSRSNIQDIINATIYNAGGGRLAKFNPKDLGHLPFPRQFAVDGLAGKRTGLIIAKR